jgi:histidinol-phosphatase
MSPDLVLAFQLADAADAVSTPPFRSLDLLVETKGDGSPVTVVDRAVEATMQAIVWRERPGDSFLGEEIGPSGSGSRRWIFDGIDGTHNYAAGRTGWATMIALEVDGIVQVAMVSSPVAGFRWYASRGDGAWKLTVEPTDGLVTSFEGAVPERLYCSSVGVYDTATVTAVPPAGFLLGWRSPMAAGLQRGVASRAASFAYYGTAVAEGALDAVVIMNGGPWDFAANSLIVEEAGGSWRDLWGGRRIDTSTMVFTNGHLTDDVLALAARLRPDTHDTPHRNQDWAPTPVA